MRKMTELDKIIAYHIQAEAMLQQMIRTMVDNGLDLSEFIVDVRKHHIDSIYNYGHIWVCRVMRPSKFNASIPVWFNLTYKMDEIKLTRNNKHFGDVDLHLTLACNQQYMRGVKFHIGDPV